MTQDEINKIRNKDKEIPRFSEEEINEIKLKYNKGIEEKVVNTFIEIEPLTSEIFLKVKETLTRIGITSNRLSDNNKPTLWQSCHIFQKKGKYYIVHFKELFLLDRKIDIIPEIDLKRTEGIAKLLETWGLIKIKSNLDFQQYESSLFNIIPYKDKNKWNLKAKYTFGKHNFKSNI